MLLRRKDGVIALPATLKMPLASVACVSFIFTASKFWLCSKIPFRIDLFTQSPLCCPHGHRFSYAYPQPTQPYFEHQPLQHTQYMGGGGASGGENFTREISL